MIHKWIATSTMVGVVIILVVVAMAWQVSPALAGFTPQPSNPPPAETPPPPRHTPPPNDTPPLVETPEMPVTGGQPSGPDNSGIFIVLLAGVMIFLLVAIRLVIRQSARTKTE